MRGHTAQSHLRLRRFALGGRVDRFDVLMVVGIIALASGIGLIDYRFGLIALGVALIGLAIVGARADVRGHVATSGKMNKETSKQGNK